MITAPMDDSKKGWIVALLLKFARESVGATCAPKAFSSTTIWIPYILFGDARGKTYFAMVVWSTPLFTVCCLSRASKCPGRLAPASSQLAISNDISQLDCWTGFDRDSRPQ
eukprot:TRINITY_DN38703_c0_g1_i1.p1 TRINITY_DN38703_c0_g1~~TRINITY_DN38703_c0_g1_i1.p1  ORF type:complete len:111 (+),score=9.80 TRINITY_DN38703_c0_g1_i1:509-841(+)